MLNTQLNERDAYRALFAFGGTLAGLDPAQVSNIAAALLNARVFTQEVVTMLKAHAPNSKGEAPVSKAEEVA
jgi:chromosome partitioning protein